MTSSIPDGYLGAGDALMRDLVFADQIESGLAPVGQYLDNSRDVQAHNIRAKRYGSVSDDPGVKAYMSGQHVSAGPLYDVETPPPPNPNNTYWYWFKDNLSFWR